MSGVFDHLVGRKVRHGNMVGRVLSVIDGRVLVDTGRGVVPVEIPPEVLASLESG